MRIASGNAVIFMAALEIEAKKCKNQIAIVMSL
jgi:hypothetical protein